MDVYCPKCADPVDNDELHDVAAEYATNYDEVRSDFQYRGCEALGMTHNTATMNSQRAAAVSAMYDLLGDDMDGASAMMEDFEYFGKW